MRLFEKTVRYLNPLAHLGEGNYSIFFALIFSVTLSVVSEILAYGVLRNPDAVGVYIIFLHVASIIYFSFRSGIAAGLTVTFIAVSYYFYIIYTRDHTGQQLIRSIETTLMLGGVYFLLAWVIGWLKQTIDVLIEQEANEKRRFRTIIQQLPVGVIVTDRKGKIEFANKNVQTILGTKIPVGFTVGEKFFVKVVESKPSPPTQSLLAKTLATGKPVFNEEFIIEKGNRKKAYVEASASPVRNAKGAVIAAAEILNDVTQQRELEHRKDDFVNMASHELKTPVTSMKLYIATLSGRVKKYNDRGVEQVIKGLQLQTDKLQELINDLLDVSRLQTGKLSFKKERFRLDELIMETADGLRDSAGGRHIAYTAKTPFSIQADRFRIYQVLTNLITNAIKYSPDGTEITIRAKRADGKVVVGVTDRGIGIDKDQQKKIFDRLYQVTGAKEKTFPGLGMGLYISKEIMKRHRGSIWVESTKGKGSTFFFSLPLPKSMQATKAA